MSRKAFALGSLFGGSLFVYDGMGAFDTHEDAVRYFNSLPRIARERTVTVERIPCVKRGVEYGTRHVVRDLSGSVALFEVQAQSAEGDYDEPVPAHGQDCECCARHAAQ